MNIKILNCTIADILVLTRDHRSTTTQDSGDVQEWASVALASYYK